MQVFQIKCKLTAKIFCYNQINEMTRTPHIFYCYSCDIGKTNVKALHDVMSKRVCLCLHKQKTTSLSMPFNRGILRLSGSRQETKLWWKSSCENIVWVTFIHFCHLFYTGQAFCNMYDQCMINWKYHYVTYHPTDILNVLKEEKRMCEKGNLVFKL